LPSPKKRIYSANQKKCAEKTRGRKRENGAKEFSKKIFFPMKNHGKKGLPFKKPRIFFHRETRVVKLLFSFFFFRNLRFRKISPHKNSCSGKEVQNPVP